MGHDREAVVEELKKEGEPECSLALPREYMSNSQVTVYHMCPRMYKYRYIDEIFRPPSVALVEGSSIHRGLEEGLAQKRDTMIDTPLDVMEDAWHQEMQERSTEVEDWGELGKDKTAGLLEARGRSFLAGYHQTVMPAVVPIAVEEKFITYFGEENIPVIGYIDAEEMRPDGKHVLVDHKVLGAAKSEKDVASDLQLSLYSKAKNVEDVKYNMFVKTKVPKIKIATSKRTALDHYKCECIFIEVARLISAGIFPHASPTSWACGPKCDYYTLCVSERSIHVFDVGKNM